MQFGWGWAAERQVTDHQSIMYRDFGSSGGETFSGSPLSWHLSAQRTELLSHLVLQNWWELHACSSNVLVQSDQVMAQKWGGDIHTQRKAHELHPLRNPE